MSYEQQLLRLITLHPRTILDCGKLESRHFSDANNGKIFDAICKMYDTTKSVSLTGLNALIGKQWASDIIKTLASIKVDGGAQFLSESIVGAHIGRSALETISIYKDSMMSGNGQQMALCELIEALSLVASEKAEDRLITGDIAADQLMEMIRNPDRQKTSIKTGINMLDAKTGGVQKSLLTIVSGVPGMGKSLLMANMILNMALAGNKIFVGSLEDRTIFVIARMLSRLSGVNSEQLVKTENVGYDKLIKLEETLDKNRDALKRIYIDDSSGQGVASIRRSVQSLMVSNDVSVAFVDHMGELSKQGKDKYTNATLNAEGLKNMANDFEIPVIAGCQVARSAVSQNATGKDGKDHKNYIPRSHNLRDSGRIEEVARSIYFVHRPWKWDREQDPHDLWINIDKQTHGKTGIVKLGVNLETMSVYSPIREVENE